MAKERVDKPYSKDDSTIEYRDLKKRFPFNIMAFPNGPICNLNCDYCYYLDKVKYYPGSKSFQMSEELLEEFTKQYIEAQPGPQVNFGWQGGEPTLRGIDFFKKAVELQQKYLPDDWQCQNNLQTNGTTLNEEWCKFLSKNEFLVGVSIDGPSWIHDRYRKNNKGESTHTEVIHGIELLKKYNIDFNILCVVNDHNSQYPVEVYNHFKEIGAEYIQFIPIVELDKNGHVGQRSVEPENYGRFLISIFDKWVRKDLGNIFIQIFEEAATAWAGYPPGLCVFSKVCGKAGVMEHNGDIYACDHYVFPEYKLGNLLQKPLIEMIQSDKQIKFGQDKQNTLPQKCLECDVKFICHGGCPKNRIITTEDGERKLNFLCEGYQMFFNYIDPYMKVIVNSLKKGQNPGLIKKKMVEIHDRIWNTGRNDPCPCGSGKKFKKCCIDRKKE